MIFNVRLTSESLVTTSEPVSSPQSALADEAYFRLSCAELGVGRPEELPDFGVALLEAGLSSSALVALASAARDDHPQDLRDLARRAFVSLGWPVPPAGGELLGMARGYCRRILDSLVDPLSGLRSMYRVWQLSDFDPLYRQWMYLDDSIDLIRDGYRGLDPFDDLTEQTIPETIRQLATTFLSQTQPG